MVCHVLTFVLTILITHSTSHAISRNMRFVTTNIRSARGKTASLNVLFFFSKKKIPGINKTCLRLHGTFVCIGDISPSVYTFHHQPRSVGRCVVVWDSLLSDHFKLKSHLIPDYSTSVCVEMSYSSFSHTLYVCIELLDSQPASLKNLRICWKIWQVYILNFTFLVILIFSWINVHQ